MGTEGQGFGNILEVSFEFLDCLITEKDDEFDAIVFDFSEAIYKWKGEIALPKLSKAEKNNLSISGEGQVLDTFKCRGCGETVEGRYISSSRTIKPLKELCDNCGHVHDMLGKDSKSICHCPFCSDRLARIIELVKTQNALIAETHFNRDHAIKLCKDKAVKIISSAYNIPEKNVSGIHITDYYSITNQVLDHLNYRCEQFFENDKKLRRCLKQPPVMMWKMFGFVVQLEVEVHIHADKKWN